MTIRPQRFILQAIHPDYACPAFETMFETDRLDELRTLLGPDAEDDPEFEKSYWLDPVEVTALGQGFGVAFEAGDREVILFKYTGSRDEAPYLIHTN